MASQDPTEQAAARMESVFGLPGIAALHLFLASLPADAAIVSDDMWVSTAKLAARLHGKLHWKPDA